MLHCAHMTCPGSPLFAGSASHQPTACAGLLACLPRVPSLCRVWQRAARRQHLPWHRRQPVCLPGRRRQQPPHRGKHAAVLMPACQPASLPHCCSSCMGQPQRLICQIPASTPSSATSLAACVVMCRGCRWGSQTWSTRAQWPRWTAACSSAASTPRSSCWTAPRGSSSGLCTTLTGSWASWTPPRWVGGRMPARLHAGWCHCAARIL